MPVLYRMSDSRPGFCLACEVCLCNGDWIPPRTALSLEGAKPPVRLRAESGGRYTFLFELEAICDVEGLVKSLSQPLIPAIGKQRQVDL